MAIINTITVPVTLVNGKATITYPLSRPKPTMVGTVTSTIASPMNLTNSINIPIYTPVTPSGDLDACGDIIPVYTDWLDHNLANGGISNNADPRVNDWVDSPNLAASSMTNPRIRIISDSQVPPYTTVIQGVIDGPVPNGTVVSTKITPWNTMYGERPSKTVSAVITNNRWTVSFSKTLSEGNATMSVANAYSHYTYRGAIAGTSDTNVLIGTLPIPLENRWENVNPVARRISLVPLLYEFKNNKIGQVARQFNYDAKVSSGVVVGQIDSYQTRSAFLYRNSNTGQGKHVYTLGYTFNDYIDLRSLIYRPGNPNWFLGFEVHTTKTIDTTYDQIIVRTQIDKDNKHYIKDEYLWNVSDGVNTGRNKTVTVNPLPDPNDWFMRVALGVNTTGINSSITTGNISVIPSILSAKTTKLTVLVNLLVVQTLPDGSENSQLLWSNILTTLDSAESYYSTTITDQFKYTKNNTAINTKVVVTARDSKRLDSKVFKTCYDIADLKGKWITPR